MVQLQDKNRNKLLRLVYNFLHTREVILLSSLPPATKLGQGYVFTGVCDSVHGGGVCLSACWDTTPPLGADTPQSRHPLRSRHPRRSRHPPPGADTPQADTPGSRHPQSRHPQGSRAPPRADTPQEQTPPSAEHAGRYGQCAGGTHPTGMQSCLEWFFCQSRSVFAAPFAVL